MEKLKKIKAAGGLKEVQKGGKIFPLHIFPDYISSMIMELAEKNNHNIDYLGSCILNAVSTAIGNTHKVRIKNGMDNCLSIFLCLVGLPGTSKTPAIKFAYRPLKKLDAKDAKEYRERDKEYQAALLDKSINPKPAPPSLIKRLLSDYTIESFFSNLSKNPRGVAVVFDELAGWFKNFNRYNASSEQESWLSIWTGENINILRKSAGVINIDSPFANVVGGIQPSVVSNLIQDGRDTNGFLSRFLFCYPVDQNKKPIPEIELDMDSFYSLYEDFINKFVQMNLFYNDFDEIEPRVLPLSKDARALFFEADKENTMVVNSLANVLERSSMDKNFHYVARFAALIELMNNGYAMSVTLESMEKAIELHYYFNDNFDRVAEILASKGRNYKNKMAFFGMLPNDSFTRKHAVYIGGLEFGLHQKTVDNWLNDTSLFKKVRAGVYQKNSNKNV